MSLQQDVDLLRNIPLFAKIEPSKLKLLAFTAERLSFSAGDLLCRQGEEGDSAYIIIDGEADVIVDTDGGQVTVATLKSNDFLGETAILCDVPRTATVRSKHTCDLFVLEKVDFNRILRDYPQFADNLCKIAKDRYDLKINASELTAAKS